MNRNLSIETLISRSPEEAYLWFSDPLRLERWFFPDAWRAAHIVFEGRPGGKFEVQLEPVFGTDSQAQSDVPASPESDRLSQIGMSVYGQVRVADYGKRLSFSWRWRGPMEHWPETMVEIEFNPIETGCRVLVKQGIFESAEQEEAHRRGWQDAFAHLQKSGILD